MPYNVVEQEIWKIVTINSIIIARYCENESYQDEHKIVGA
jgi:hypothetical protein